MRTTGTALLLIAIAAPCAAHAADEISLFDNFGKPVAYIEIENGTEDDTEKDNLPTIYLWNGKPAAYLFSDDGSVHVYGFNGRHLGWFDEGLVISRTGKVACAVKERTESPQFETLKGLKQFRPFKGFREFAPMKPLVSDTFGPMSCGVLLASGI